MTIYLNAYNGVGNVLKRKPNRIPVDTYTLANDFVLHKEGNVLFNDALNTFYLRLYGVRHMVKDHCRHMGYSFRLAAKVHLYASSHRQVNTYHSVCYTSRGALAGMINSTMGPP